jgi:hypothetical protein
MSKFVVVLTLLVVGLCHALKVGDLSTSTKKKTPDASMAPFRADNAHGHHDGASGHQHGQHMGHHSAGGAAGPGSLQAESPEVLGQQSSTGHSAHHSPQMLAAGGKMAGAEEFQKGLPDNEEVVEVVEPAESDSPIEGVIEKNKAFPGMRISQTPTLNVHQPVQDLSPALARSMMSGDDVPYNPDGMPMDPNKSKGGDSKMEGSLSEPWVGQAIEAMPPCPVCVNDCPEAEEEEAEGDAEDEAPAPVEEVLIPLCPRCICHEQRPPSEEGEEEEGE